MWVCANAVGRMERATEGSVNPQVQDGTWECIDPRRETWTHSSSGRPAHLQPSGVASTHRRHGVEQSDHVVRLGVAELAAEAGERLVEPRPRRADLRGRYR
eukprot:317004-Chlamydomonas_euryale.AAC.1